MRIGLASLLVNLLLYLSYCSTFLTASVSPLVFFEEEEPPTESSRIDRHAYRQTSPPTLVPDLNLRNNNYRDFEEGYQTTFDRENLTFADLKKEQKSYKNNGGKVKLVLGYLTAVKGELKERQGLAISGAISMAIQEINNDMDTLPGVELELKWNDTKGDNVLGARVMTDMLCEGVAAFFGPEGSCYVEAIVSQARNVPMISYKCSDHRASSVPTFARTEPPDTQVTKSIIALLKYYNWKKFSIVYEEGWKTVAQSLETQALHMNMSVQHNKNAVDRHICCSQNLKCCESSFWYEFIQESKNQTRIYVFLGTAISLVEFMDTMQTARLFENGEYIVIYVDMNIYLEREVNKYIFKSDQLVNLKYEGCEHMPEYASLVKRVKSLFVVVLSVPTENYKNFSKEVSEYNMKEPFEFEMSILNEYKFQKYVSIYAAYLYDSVKLYASAMHHLIAKERVIKKRDLNETEIREISKNGTRIIQTIIEINQTYNSITGAVIKLDKNGDSEGNFSVLAYQEVKDRVHLTSNLRCNFHLEPVGQFYQSEDFSSFPQYKKKPNTQIAWAAGDKPNDEPSCGFDNKLCPKSNTHRNSIIAAGVLAVILFCAGVITMSIYRKWKIEQEIEGLLWKIDREDIHSYCEKDNNIISSPSKLSLVSASVTSYESKIGLQVFTTTANYRGLVVRIKELNFSRKKDISREIMKEMRLLRELRHDNVNSFIGACVQPTSILLVTDYCAKGSLYDIIENEDIKLDKMFIASLVHDLIKGMLYLHNSLLGCHGNLKSSNCVVTSRWVLQVTDFGLPDLRHCAENESIGEHQYYRSLFWKAPEILRNPDVYIRGSKSGDVYAFAIILFEILGRRGPFGNTGYEPKHIIDYVRKIPRDGEEPFRPDVDILYDSEINLEKYVIDVMTECWAESPEQRPDFSTIRIKLKRMKEGKSKNIMDQMMDMMVTYANNLEELVTERTRLLYEEKNKTEDLLHRMLPKPVAESLTKGYGVEPESYDSVTIYFSDIVGFTAMSAESTPLQVVNFLNDLYTVFDRIIKGYDVYKVETIGDAYMVVSGLPIKNGDRHVGEIASMALDLLAAVKSHTISHRPKETLKLRIGIHTGPVVAGVVGLTMPRYCLFGDTVNTASRMESNGEALKIHISLQCKDALDRIGGYVIQERGVVCMKGKGEVVTYWLVDATEKAIQRREVDLTEYPPLFCRPRRSPRLNNESRQPSFIGGYGGLINRRHSSVLREPGGSKLTLNSAFGSQMIEEPEMASRMVRQKRMLSSIASSSEEPTRSFGRLNRIRESKSLDMFPIRRQNTTSDLINSFLKGRRKSTKSLGNNNCDRCGDIQIIAIPGDKIVNNNFPNGNLLGMPIEEDHNFLEDAQAPLLFPTPKASNPIVVKHKGGNDYSEGEFPKRWHSLEPFPQTCDTSSDCEDKKINSRNAIKNWLVGIFNGNSLKSSQASLKKSVLSDYNNLNLEVKKESLV